MITDKDYKDLVSFAERLIKNKPELSAYDIVNDCILKILEDKEVYNIGILKKSISIKCKGEYLLKLNYKLPEDSTRVCKICKESMPIGMFYIGYRKNGGASISSYCKKCFYEYAKKYRERRRYTENAKAYNRNRWLKAKTNRKEITKRKEYHYNYRRTETGAQKMRDASKRYYYRHKKKNSEFYNSVSTS